jgi:hypothetical protein
MEEMISRNILPSDAIKFLALDEVGTFFIKKIIIIIVRLKYNIFT